jgi:rare lipoprotein A
VVNPRNGRSVTVRITDRGPFIKGRSLDLSLGAAKVLGITAQGVARVAMYRTGTTGSSEN